MKFAKLGLIVALLVASVGVIGSTTAPSVQAACTIAQPQRYGARNTQVKCVQQTLKDRGVNPGPVDGIFGNQTRGAVVTYQRRSGLYVDGVVGPQTAGSLGIWGTASSSSTASSAPATRTCSPSRNVPANATTVVDVRSSGSRATVQLMTRSGSGWTCQGSAMSGRLGRNGTRALASRVGGDGTTPSGVFPLGTMTAPNGDRFQFFGNRSNPGVQGGWHQVRANDCWWVDPGTSKYNTLISVAQSGCSGENEYLPNYQNSYSRAALIGANMGPGRIGDQPGETPRAAAIFLHRHSYDAGGSPKATAGCVSLSGSNLDFVLRRLPVAGTYFAIT